MNITNPILNTDSYKLGHFRQYPPEISAISGYITTRGQSFRPEVVFFGLQMFLKEHLSRAITAADIAEAEEISRLHGQPFNREGWEYIVNTHGGYLPLRIDALPEGTAVRRDVPMVQVVNTDPKLPWVTSYIETALLRAIWYPSTVASNARRIWQTLAPLYESTSDDAQEMLPLALSDFGARGVASAEQAGLGGAAHLLYFHRTDTLAAILAARKYYGAEMAGRSIPASEHTTMVAWGLERETDAYANMIESFSEFGAYSVVSDSFDIANAVAEIWGKTLQDKVRNAGATLIVRPDSGDPIDTPVQVVAQLAYAFGTKQNSKGYKVIEGNARVLQADGLTTQDITMVLGRLEGMGFAAENISFGMGGSLLQKVNRNSYSFTMKCSAKQNDDGKWHDMSRLPPNPQEKLPRAGRRAVAEIDGALFDMHVDELAGRENLLQPVWENGRLLKDLSFAEIRARAAL